MKKIILISLVVGSVGYYLYQKSKSLGVASAMPAAGSDGEITGNDTVSSGTTTGNSLNDFFNDLLSTGTNNNTNTAANNTAQAGSGTTLNDANCIAPVLFKVSKNATGQLVADWQNTETNYLKSVTVEFTTNGKDWKSGITSGENPVTVANVSDYNKNVTLKAANNIMTVRLKGNCKNGKTTDYSNYLRYNLLTNIGSQLA